MRVHTRRDDFKLHRPNKAVIIYGFNFSKIFIIFSFVSAALSIFTDFPADIT